MMEAIAMKCATCPFDDGCETRWQYVVVVDVGRGKVRPMAVVFADGDGWQRKPCGRMVKAHHVGAEGVER
jgi:hypothetical protein